MKYTAITLAALSVSTVQAVAVAGPDAAADPWCLFRGEGCWKAKRDAAPAPAPAPVAAADPWCLFRGEGCWKRDASPEADALPWCLFRGEGCWKEKREALAAPEPEADAEADPWCLFRGEGCWKEKREAAPVAEADPEAWCLFRGEGCWKVKRAAYAFANAIRSAGAIKESRAAEVSNMQGGAAYNAKRAIEDIGSALAGRTDSPVEFFKKLAILKHFHPDVNFTIPTATTNLTRRAVEGVELAEREETDNTRRWCLFRGEGCWKRDAAPWCLFRGEGCWKRSVPMEAREAAADPWCLFRGEGCWKRAEETTPALEARAADAAPAFCPLGGAAANTCYASKRDFVAADKRACNQPGEACDVARRAAEALVSEIESGTPLATTKRDSDVEARWCLFRGEGCWKRDNMDDIVARCEAEGGACHQARRDLTAVHTAARNLLEYLNEE